MSENLEVPPSWTMLPLVVLVLSMALLPVLITRLWSRHWFQGLIVVACAAPVVGYFSSASKTAALLHAGSGYVSFITTLAALYITAGGVYATADLEGTPRTNAAFLGVGAILASLIGTTGASMLVIRPLLRTNSQRQHTQHLVPFFILAVANAGGLLTPLGDPPLLVGFIRGVPFFWTLRLLPAWLLYVGVFVAVFYVIDRKAYARESPSALSRDRREKKPLELRGARNLLWLAAIVAAAFLPPVFRETGMVAIALLSYAGTDREVHELNGLALGALLEVALLFFGLFACLTPVELGLAKLAPELPLQRSWQLFWGAGVFSAVLDNAPTYAAFSALARGLKSANGALELIAGIEPLKLAAISTGSVVMGATTYIGNGPNLMVKAIAERHGFVLPSFARFAAFAFLVMLPAHLVMTVALILLEP